MRAAPLEWEHWLRSGLAQRFAVEHPTKAKVSFASTRMSRGLSLGFGMLRRNLWLWPLLAAAMLAAAGLWIRQAVESAAQMEMAEGLEATLNSNVEALKI